MGFPSVPHSDQATDLPEEVVSDSALRALVYELKNPLITIARQAELDDEVSRQSIQRTAEQALRLIDSYLLMASEHGQMRLELSPMALGSVLYDVAQDLRDDAKLHQKEVLIHDRTHEPVMTNRPALVSILTMFAAVILGSSTSDKPDSVLLRGYKTRGGALGVGVFSNNKLSQADIEVALQLQGKAHMPLARIHHGAHVSLAIADSLCRALGGAMVVKHMGALSGLATELPRSEQLELLQV